MGSVLFRHIYYFTTYFQDNYIESLSILQLSILHISLSHIVMYVPETKHIAKLVSTLVPIFDLYQTIKSIVYAN